MKKESLDALITLPEDLSLEAYTKAAEHNLFTVFDIKDTSDNAIPFKEFLQNTDHGLLHTYHVYKKACEIADVFQEAGIPVDTYLLFVMSGMHDSGRFRIPIPKMDDSSKKISAKEKKKKTAERFHNRYGVAQVRLAGQLLQKKGISLNDKQEQAIKDYILNHDFFSARLDGTDLHEPVSLEGQIVRLADRVSVPVEEEVMRYWETGKRLGTLYFNPAISFQERLDFSFVHMGSYITSGKFDEFTFFLALLSMREEEFQHPLLQKLYRDWSITKKQGVQKILDIAKAEGYASSDIQQMKKLIDAYLSHFDVRLGE